MYKNMPKINGGPPKSQTPESFDDYAPDFSSQMLQIVWISYWNLSVDSSTVTHAEIAIAGFEAQQDSGERRRGTGTGFEQLRCEMAPEENFKYG